ncbi:class I SAM-dependent methyltransferase [Halarsenatibacter silvermanii]|uniref:Methyltransferase domain-containing protein n=1 Tax=Halarsenatibacter silvermanii TaxID=321763 RepID=A0A1G9H8Y6_9FIRM|nr:class I SAM-dependent methyltransferase [Halarsenatibacter silvermanii]SDL09451.1 Methyltransferase domain-containing protein [Halarsenatibacter silvermanii]
MIFDDEEAEEYDDWYETELGAFADKVETRLAFSLFEPEAGSRVLDAGCGTGNFSIKLARRGLSVVGVDVSASMLEKARNKVERLDEDLDIEFARMDAIDLEFPAESFDHAISMAAVEFIEDDSKEKFVRELLKTVKPGGEVLIGTINKNSAWGEAYRERAQKRDSIFSEAHFTSPEELNEIEKELLQESRECLFIPPDAESQEISLERENELAKREVRGGFFCSLWQKPGC